MELWVACKRNAGKRQGPETERWTGDITQPGGLFLTLDQISP